MITNSKGMEKASKNLEKILKGKQKDNNKCHCNNANIITFPNKIVYMFIV